MNSSSDLLKTALALHQAGQLDDAERGYRKIEEASEEFPDALHLLGVLAHQRGDHRGAVQLISDAITRRQDAAPMHANLAEACRATGDLGRAVNEGRRALELQPDYPTAQSNLALALMALGELAEASELLRAAIKSEPASALAHNNLGNVLRLQGRDEDAIAEFREVVRLEPAGAEGLSNLGQLLLETGEAEEALTYCGNAVKLSPQFAAGLSNLGNVLRELQQFDKSINCYEKALKLRPELAITHNNMGQVIQEMGGRLDEAINWYRQSLRLDPNSARAMTNLASALLEQEHEDEALVHYRKAVALDPRYAEARVGLAGMLREAGESAAAEIELREAIRLKPRLAAAQVSLANLLKEGGNFDEAVSLARKALDVNHKAVGAYSLLATTLSKELPEADYVEMVRLDESGRVLGEGAKATLGFALAAACDTRGNYARAASHLKKANAFAKAGRERHGKGYAPQDHHDFVGSLIEACTPEWFERVEGFGLDTEVPIFIVGMPRSGTTLLEQILASHPQIHGAGELKLLRQGFERLPAVMQRQEPPTACLSELSREAAQRTAQAHLEALARLGNGKLHIVDKMPDNYLYLGLIRALFPNAKIIHSRREMRDVALSCWITQFGQIRWANDLGQITERIGGYIRIMQHWREVQPDAFIEVDYEEVVADLESQARRLIDWCGLDWDPACLEFHKTRRVVKTASVTQVRRPVYTSSVGRWKRYESELGDWFGAIARLVSRGPGQL